MNIEHFDIDDFLTDDSFFESVKNPNCEEALFWNTWLNDHPHMAEKAEQARRIMLSVDFNDKSFNQSEITQLWSDIKKKTVEVEKRDDSNSSTTVALSPWRHLKVAAVLFPFFVATVLFLFYREAPESQQTIIPKSIEKFNPRGQKLTVFLSDGSRVKLNAESKITYQKPFNEKERVVQLEGEAFFEVVPDKDRPFIVKTGNLETKVLGTSFNVKAYPEEDRINVAVKHGMVSVEDKDLEPLESHGKSIVLSPLEMASYSKSDKKVDVSTFNAKDVLSWSEGILYFNDACMNEFVSKLERWYGVDIEVQRETPIKKGIVGEFKDQSLDEILIGTKDASEFEYKITDNNSKVIIY